MKKKNKVLLTSMATIAMCASLVAGGTYALFTSESVVNIAVSSGTVDVTATASDATVTSVLGTPIGTANVDNNTVTLTNIVPGDTVTFKITVTNNSNVAVNYRTVIKCLEDTGLMSGLQVTFDEGTNKQTFTGSDAYADWAKAEPGEGNKEIAVSITLPKGAGNEYQSKSCKLAYTVEAVQGNAEVENPIDYNAEENVYYVNNETGMMLMNGIVTKSQNDEAHGEGRELNFALNDDMDMTGYDWTPIRFWWVTLDGQGHTISNLNCGVDNWGRSGFAGYAGGGWMKDFTLENVTAEGTQAGVVAGSIEGKIITGVTIAGTNSVTYNAEKNPAETWGGVGAIAGVSGSVTNMSVTIADGATVTVNHNGNVSQAPGYNKYSQLQDISAYVTDNGTVTEIGEHIYGFLVSDDESLAAAISDINTKNAFWNKPVTVVMKGGVYEGEYTLKQFPEWGGVDAQNKGSAQTDVTFVGKDGAMFTGILYVNGYGQGKSNFNDSENVKTVFKNVHFDAGMPSVDDGTDYLNLYVQKGADNVTFDVCNFTNATHINFGGSGTNGTGDIAFTGCTFNYGGNISGGPRTLTITDCTFNGGYNGFVNVQRGGNGNGIVTVTGTTVNCEEYGFRTNAQAEVAATNSTFNIALSATENMGALVLFRGDKAKATFTDCELHYVSVVNYKGSANAGNTTVTIDGVVAEQVTAADQSSLNTAINSSSNVNVTLNDGNYTMPSASNSDVTISGTESTVVTVEKPNMTGTDVTFNGVTVQGSGYSTGVQHVNTVTYNDVTIKGEMCLYGEKVVFNNCTFELAAGQYLWTYAAEEVEFNNCTFNTNGKAILIYNEGAAPNQIVTVRDCIFNATASAKAGDVANQACAAIEISTENSNGNFTLILEGNNVYDSNFSGLWRVKKIVENSSVTVSGVVYSMTNGDVFLDGVAYTKDSNKNVTKK